MKARVNMEKIAKALGAERRGGVRARGGYFGAMQLVADVQARFRVPTGGGRPTDPSWTERRLVPLTEETLTRLEELAQEIEKKRHVRVEPMQVAALLLENAAENIADEDIEQIAARTETSG